MRDKELFQTPVLPSRHRRSLNRREAALSNGREDDRMILLYFLETIFLLQVNRGTSRVTAIQQVPPDGMGGWVLGGGQINKNASTASLRSPQMEAINWPL